MAAGVTQDDAEAVEWFRLAAKRGHAEAQYNLGLMYAEATGVEKDYVQALNWWRLAADSFPAFEAENLDRAIRMRDVAAALVDALRIAEAQLVASN